MTSEAYTAQAQRAAAAVIARSDVAVPVLSYELLVSLLAAAWLDGVQHGIEEARPDLREDAS